MKKKTMLLTLVLACTLILSVGCGRRMNSATDGTDKNSQNTQDTTVEENNSDGTLSNGTTNNDNNDYNAGDNFDNNTTRSWIKIPEHAFECLNIPTDGKPLSTKDLLTGKKGECTLVPDGTVYVEVPAYGGKILKMKI
jgi:hypothetical protein